MLLRPRDCLYDDCENGVRPSTYATAIAIVPMQPMHAMSRPLAPPPLPAFEPAPPYDPSTYKPPPQLDADTRPQEAPSGPPPNPPLQYPPPSYSPA
ncbi:hypothetical protein FPV67DRAFT_1487688 [Lyophyllum atratum]|nr:hypothetical protein FPV67DRAFT_1487688 [Lyophyllum atratum]